MARSRVLVTGATGYLAGHLLPKLESPLGLIRSPERWKSQPNAAELRHVELVTGTVEDPEAWSSDPRLSSVSTIMHLAALVRHSRHDADEVYRANVDGTLALVRACARLRARLVFVSTSGTVGCFRSAEARADEDSPHCHDVVGGWPYYDSKIRAEQQAQALAQQLGVELIIVRLPVLLGPGDHRGRSVSHVARVMERRLPFIVPGGIAYADVRDVASGLAALAASREGLRPIYHLCGTSSSLEEFFRTCAEIAEVPMPRVHVSAPWALRIARGAERVFGAFGKKSPLPDGVIVEMATHHWGVTSKYAHEIGYVCRPGRETIADTVAWLRQREGRHAGPAVAEARVRG